MASAWSCVTYSVVVPSRFCRRLISPRIDVRSLASRFESGSSMRNTDGSRTIARASATRCRWPPERCRGRRSSRCGISSDSATRCTPARWSALLSPRMRSGIADVLGHGHVRIERVALEHHRDVAVARLDARHVAVADVHGAGGRDLEAGEHAQGGRLAAARRAEQHEERAVGHVEVERAQRQRLRRRSASRCRGS